MVRKGSALRIALAAVLVVAGLVIGAGPATAACGAAGTPTTTIYLPNITKTLGGPAGWYTPFIVQNVGTVPTNLEVSFFRFSDGSLVTCRTVGALAAGTSFADVPNNDTDLPGDTQFAVVVKSFGASVVSVVNEHQGSGARAEALSYVGLSSGTTRAYIPYVAKFVNGWLTTFVVQNLGAANANVTMSLTSYDGTKTASLARQIGPGRSAAIDPSVEPSLVSGTEYAVTLSSDQPIAAIANAQNDAPTVDAPMGFSVNAVAQPQSVPMYVPKVSRNADGVGRTTRVLVQNAGSTDATPSLLFRTGTGAQVTVNAPAALHPGAAWSYDPRFAADGVTGCPPAGSATCPAEGTYGLTVQGGAFAVEAASLTPTSAMGVIGSAGAGNRAYLPNVTRTLGGAQGWTTPIVLQSTGATSATLRWYRFSDGALMTRQFVLGLVSGASFTVDPRAVSGLTDDTQYAVVVDATGGTLAAIVTELNFLGGDGDMAYEGFAATVSTVPTPTALSVQPSIVSVTAGGVQQLTVLVKDQFDNVMNAGITWTVTPSTLGTVSATNAFTGGTPGTGTLTATTGTLSASVPVTVQGQQTRTVGGFTFVVQSLQGVDLYVQDAISVTDRSTLTTAAPADVVQVQADFARAYALRPQVYAFASTSAFTQGLQTVLGVSATQATTTGAVVTGIWVNNAAGESIGIDWQKQAVQLPVSAMRHELTHWMEHQIAGNGAMPAWFDEGNARSEEFTVANGQSRVNQNRYGAASMSATNTLFSLADMTDVNTWNSRSGLAGIYQYYAASQAVQFLRSDLGMAGVVRIIDLVAQGIAFSDAYTTVSAQPFSAFSSAYATRVRLLSLSYPGIVTATDTQRGPGMTIELYGFTPGAQVTMTIAGPVSSVPATRTIDQFGTFTTFLDSQWPTGTYTITATWTGGVVTTTGVKTSSLLDAMLDTGVVGPLPLPDFVPGERDWISSAP